MVDGSTASSRHASVSMPVRPSMRNNRAQSLPMPIDVSCFRSHTIFYTFLRLKELQPPKYNSKWIANLTLCSFLKCVPH